MIWHRCVNNWGLCLITTYVAWTMNILHYGSSCMFVCVREVEGSNASNDWWFGWKASLHLPGNLEVDPPPYCSLFFPLLLFRLMSRVKKRNKGFRFTIMRIWILHLSLFGYFRRNFSSILTFFISFSMFLFFVIFWRISFILTRLQILLQLNLKAIVWFVD